LRVTAGSETPSERRWRLIRIAFLVVLVQVSIAYFLVGGFRALTGPGLVTHAGSPIGLDFMQYYSVSTLALDGRAPAAYELAELHRVERQVIGAEVVRLPWFYPPTFMLVVSPLALMPYLAALALWLGLTLIAYLVVVYRIAPHPVAPLLALVFPAATDVVISGQNGFLSAALLGGGLLLLERRPLLAGLLIGLLSYKPHLGALIPVALIAGGYWRAFAAAAVTVLVFAAVSVAVFGLEPWLAFLDSVPLAREEVEVGRAPWRRMPTVLGAARLLGLDVATAWGLQGLAALAAASVVFALWRRPVSLAMRASALVLAIPLATPYALYYDLAILALPVAWLAWEHWRGPGLTGERSALVLLWIGPIGTWALGRALDIPAWPVLLAGLLAVVWRRAGREGPRAR
jgi:hypothetical protein